MTVSLAHTRDTATAARAAAQVYYDSGCPVCRREIGWYRAMRGAERIDWRDIRETPDADLPGGYSRADLLNRFTVRRGDGKIVEGGPAFIALWRGLRPTAALGRICDRQPIRWLAERCYRLFLRIRPLWYRPG